MEKGDLLKEKEEDVWMDWMDPKSSIYKVESSTKRKYLIMRQKRMICFGNPGYIDQWEFWSSFHTAAERDAEYDRLKEAYPSWILKKETKRPLIAYLR